MRLFRRRPKVDLTLTQEANLLAMGLRGLEVRDEHMGSGFGDAIGGVALVPTWEGRDRLAKFARGAWEGSYVPLVVYRGGRGALLVGEPQTKDPGWQSFAEDVGRALGLQVSLRQD